MNVTERDWLRWSEDAATLAELRDLWHRMHDYGSTFTTPKERLAAGEKLRAILDR